MADKKLDTKKADSKKAAKKSNPAFLTNGTLVNFSKNISIK